MAKRPVSELALMKKLETETGLELIKRAHLYLMEGKSFPLKKINFSIQAHFSAIYSFLKKASLRSLDELERVSIAPEFKDELRKKVKAILAVHSTRVGLLSNYSKLNEPKILTERKDALCSVGEHNVFAGM